MSFYFAHGQISWFASDAAGVTYTATCTDVGGGGDFQPKAIRFYWTGVPHYDIDADSDITLHQRRGVGFATSTSSRRCIVTSDLDAAATMTCATGYFTDCVAADVFGSTTGHDGGALDLDALLSTGFRVIVDLQVPLHTAVNWEAWGGTDITVAQDLSIAEPAGTGTVDYTVTGFTATDSDDQVVMIAGCQATGAANVASARNDSGFCVGFATGGATTENVVIVGNVDDNFATADADGYGLAGECLAMIVVAGGDVDARAKLDTTTPFGTNFFRLNWLARATTDRRYIALAIKGGSWRAGETTLNMNTLSATTTVASLPFTPAGVSLISQGRAVENTSPTTNTIDAVVMGTASGTASRRVMSVTSADGPTAAEVIQRGRTDAVLLQPVALTTTGRADINAWNSDGFQLIVDEAGSGVASTWIGYLVYGQALESHTHFVYMTV